jgi:hypothetical protein
VKQWHAREMKMREERISMEAVVDAYDSGERAMGWYYHLDRKIKVPFKARCRFARPISVLKVSIAVLPFQNMSSEPEQEYFADGIVTDIIAGFSAARRSVAASWLSRALGDAGSPAASVMWRSRPSERSSFHRKVPLVRSQAISRPLAMAMRWI